VAVDGQLPLKLDEQSSGGISSSFMAGPKRPQRQQSPIGHAISISPKCTKGHDCDKPARRREHAVFQGAQNKENLGIASTIQLLYFSFTGVVIQRLSCKTAK